MTYILLAAFIIQSVAFIVCLDRLTTRHGKDIQTLCQRIQDPVAAVAQHAIGTDQQIAVQHLPFDDDAAWVTYQTEIGTDPLA